MWSIAQIAARDGVSKAAVSKAVKKLLDDRPEAPAERGAQGQVMRVSLAHYDHYRQCHVNPAKATAPLRSADGPSSDGRLPLEPPALVMMRDEESFEEARRQSEWLKVGREKIRVQEECGQLLRRDETERAVSMIGAELQAIIRRLPNRADDIALAVSKEGAHGVRVLMREIAFEIGNEMAEKLAKIAETAPETDALLDGDMA